MTKLTQPPPDHTDYRLIGYTEYPFSYLNSLSGLVPVDKWRRILESRDRRKVERLSKAWHEVEKLINELTECCCNGSS